MTNSFTTRDASGGLWVRRPHPILVPVILMLCFVGCDGREYDIDSVSVERVVTTLSADEMLGRAPFTPAIDKAAAFIRDEFTSIGLNALGGLNGYLQRFTAYRLEARSRRVVLNGVEIPIERSAVEAGASSVHWTTGGSRSGSASCA